MAAIAAAGLVGDRESMPALLKLVAKGKDHNTRYNAIYALGQLKAREAVPLLVGILSEPPHYGNGFYCPLGIYGKDGGYTTQVSLVEVAVRAAARIGDEQAMPAFEALLRNDGYYLDHDTVAEAAADLGWKQLVPAIIGRLAKDHAANLEQFGPAHEEYSVALRRLTGQTFGEDPKAWREWLKQQNP
ncbi:MAG: HEAT repeat domain-containing protein [Planctomycetota bacterium]|nr:HEAT repeat domain-containing protein [Planctomycetota bacterium]